jgi:hypothetical protein
MGIIIQVNYLGERGERFDGRRSGGAEKFCKKTKKELYGKGQEGTGRPISSQSPNFAYTAFGGREGFKGLREEA